MKQKRQTCAIPEDGVAEKVGSRWEAFEFEPIELKPGDAWFVSGEQIVFERNGKEFARRKLTKKKIEGSLKNWLKT